MLLGCCVSPVAVVIHRVPFIAFLVASRVACVGCECQVLSSPSSLFPFLAAEHRREIVGGALFIDEPITVPVWTAEASSVLLLRFQLLSRESSLVQFLNVLGVLIVWI